MTSFRFHITLLLTIGLVFAVDFSQAADITTNKSGDWNAPSTWKGGTVPSPNDNVTIRAKVTLSSNQSCASLTVATDGTLNITTSSTLTINGDFSNSGTFSAGTGTVIFSGGNFSNSGTFSEGNGTVIFSGSIAKSIT
ncbi:MAG: hypothetical protein Q8862_06105 [Bacteroidota bacterium]|nr:hypothetical protein [Bacteroidota bacterium]